MIQWVRDTVMPTLRYDFGLVERIAKQAAEIEELKQDYALLTLDFNLLLSAAGTAEEFLHGFSGEWKARSMTLGEFMSLLYGLGVDTTKKEFCTMLCDCGYLLEEPKELECLPTFKGVKSGFFDLCVTEGETGATHYQTQITPEGIAFIVSFFQMKPSQPHESEVFPWIAIG